MRYFWGALLLLSGCMDKAGPLAMTLEPVIAPESVELRMEPFEREVYPYLQANCALCHSVGVGRAGAFASGGLRESFEASVRLVEWSAEGTPMGALVQFASNGHCGTPSRCALPAGEWMGRLSAWYEESLNPAPSPSPTPSPSMSPISWSHGRRNQWAALPASWRVESGSFSTAEFALTDSRVRLRLEGRRSSQSGLSLRNPRLVLSSGAVVAGDLIVSAGLVRGSGDGDFSQALRDVAGPTVAGGVALLTSAQTISIAVETGTEELLLSFGTLESSDCLSYAQFENFVLPVLQAQCASCHQASFFEPLAGACRSLLERTLPRDAVNSPLLLRPQGAFGHATIGLSGAESAAIRSWIEAEGALR